MPAAAARRRPTDEPVAAISVQSVALTVLAALAAIVMLRYAGDVFVPLVLAILLSYALEPVVAAGTALRIPRSLAAALVLLAVVCSAGSVVYALSDDVLAIVERLPVAARQLRAQLRPGPDGEATTLQKVQQAAREIERSAAAAAGVEPPPAGVPEVNIQEKPLDVRGNLWTGWMGVLGLGAQGLLLLFLSYFLLSAGDLYRRKLVQMAPSLSRKRVTLEVLSEINQQIQRYLLVQVCTSVLVGMLSALAFWWLGLEQAAVWGLAAGLFNTVPYFGPAIVSAAVAIVGYLQFGTPSMAVALAGSTFAITSLEGSLLTPWLMGRAARMNEVAVFVGLMFWSWMWGVVGMLLAVPMLVVVKSICDRVDDLKPLGELLGD